MRNLSDFSLRAAIPVGVALLTLAGASQAASPAVGPPSVLAVAAADTDKDKDKKDDSLDEVVVTGSLIPQVRAETSTPVTVITADDIKDRGFESVAEALQHSSFATGSVQGAQFTAGFTPGVQTLSFFGLSPSYTKYLIDGRPLADYPALYNGTDAVNTLSGLPTALVDHVDILPGASSSIYGSDAIAGVINIVLKKKLEGFEADARYGWTKDGGGVDKRLALADGFNFGTVNIIVGAQYEKTDPIYGYQRPLTNQYDPNGTSPQTAERDFLVDGVFGPTGDGSNAYYFEDPADCANASGLFNHSLKEQFRPDHGSYCGTTNAGYYTLNNGSESVQGYIHASDDINEHVSVFTDVLIDHDWVKFTNGTGFYQNALDPSKADYYDPRLAGGQGDYVAALQRIFSPEEAGGLQNTGAKNTTNSIRATIGVKGDLVAGFNYETDFTYTENKLTESTIQALTAPTEAFFSSLYGPQLGLDPNGFGLPVYEPNYAQFYLPLTPAQYASFNGTLNNYSRTEESLARILLTNQSLFALPGGNAGLALLGEGGDQGWNYAPDANYFDGGSLLYTAVAGSGHRSRYAATAELKLPVFKMLTFDLSSRYDDYRVLGENVDKATYNIGVEFRPHPTILFRGRYGTAFKAPTLADEFQGKSGYFEGVTDYYKCATLGFTVQAGNIGNCPDTADEIQGSTQGNPSLKPITAVVSDIGLAWSPLERFSFTTDFIRYNIKNEIETQPTDQLLREELACRSYTDTTTGITHPPTLDPSSPTCVSVLSEITRDSFTGLLATLFTPKVNVSQEVLNVLTMGFNYDLVTSVAGKFLFEGSYSDLFKHSFTQFAGDATIDEINNPFYSTDFKSKENFSVTWDFHKLGLTAYVERYGRTPNNLAQGSTEGYAAPGAGRVGTWTLVNFSGRYEVIKGLTLSANIVNAFNKMPPVDNSFAGTDNQPYNIFNYNNYGRSYFVEANYKFGQGK
jgi:outer membrane receptor protein involved in Fe transport